MTGNRYRKMFFFAAVVAVIFFRGRYCPGAEGAPKVAIAPFQGDDAAFGAELADAIAILLLKSGAVEVVQWRRVDELVRTAGAGADALKNGTASAPKIASAAGVSRLVTGSLKKNKDGSYAVEIKYLEIENGIVTYELNQSVEGERGRIFLLLGGFADAAHSKIAGSRIPRFCPAKSGAPACAQDFILKTDTVYKFVARNTDFGVRVWLDRPGENREPPVYRQGEKLKVYIQANRDCYVYIFGVDTSGNIKPLFRDAKSWPVKAVKAKVYTIPGESFPFELAAKGQGGLERVVVLASDTQLKFEKSLYPIDNKGAALKKDAASLLNSLSFFLKNLREKGAKAAAAQAVFYIE